MAAKGDIVTPLEGAVGVLVYFRCVWKMVCTCVG